jgi:RsiW-degrading membrane proteinase PrsW (M82 family)
MPILGVILSVLFSFVPMLLFACIVYWTDRYEKEPKLLLGGVFIWGAIVAAGAAFIVNSFLGLGVYFFTGSQSFSEFSTSSIIAPVIEETLKGVACLLVFLYFRHEFDSILDGIVYAAITALGFAATENVYYIYTYGFQENGLRGILWMFFIRVILVGWQHPFYTAFIGIGLAISRLNRNRWIITIIPIIGLGIAIIMHSIHNTISTVFQGLASIGIELLFDWSGWIAMAIFIIWALYREQRWIVIQLGEEVTNKIITLAQYKTACSAWSQTSARIAALFSGQYTLINRFYSIAVELAYKKQHRLIPGDNEGNPSEIDRLRAELGRLSSQFTA